MASKKQCERALDLHEERLSSLSNVVGLGIVSESSRGAGARRFVVAVYVTAKLPRAELDESEIVPETVEVPGRSKTKHRIRTRVIEQGEVELEFGKERL